jgi:hypothetical protein
MSPRSPAQSQNLNTLINVIKRVMHPNLALGGFALDFPNLVTIEFNNDKEGVLKVDYAFISAFSVDPTPHGQVFYREGYPAIVKMSMHVKEIRIKTTEDFPVTQDGMVYGQGALGSASQQADAATK